MKKKRNILFSTTNLIAVLGLAVLSLLSIITVLDIFGRELFSTPIDGFSDMSDLIIIFAAVACFPASFLAGSHVKIDLMGALIKRTAVFFNLLGALATLIVVILISYNLCMYFYEVYENNQTTWLLYIPVWPVWLISALVFIFCIPLQIYKIITLFQKNK